LHLQHGKEVDLSTGQTDSNHTLKPLSSTPL
jgi:hypothetical protein